MVNNIKYWYEEALHIMEKIEGKKLTCFITLREKYDLLLKLVTSTFFSKLPIIK
jgi:hypothetical protein